MSDNFKPASVELTKIALTLTWYIFNLAIYAVVITMAWEFLFPNK